MVDGYSIIMYNKDKSDKINKRVTDDLIRWDNIVYTNKLYLYDNIIKILNNDVNLNKNNVIKEEWTLDRVMKLDQIDYIDYIAYDENMESIVYWVEKCKII